MSIQEILEAHTQSIRNGRCSCEDRGPKRTGIEHDAHVAEVLDEAMWEREAEAVRASARYIERLYPLNGPINKADVLADLEIAADRLSRGLHAN